MVSLSSFKQFMVYKSIDVENCHCFFFFFHNNMEKVRTELALFSVKKAHTVHLTLIDNSCKPISAQEFWQSL